MESKDAKEPQAETEGARATVRRFGASATLFAAAWAAGGEAATKGVAASDPLLMALAGALALAMTAVEWRARGANGAANAVLIAIAGAGAALATTSGATCAAANAARTFAPGAYSATGIVIALAGVGIGGAALWQGMKGGGRGATERGVLIVIGLWAIAIAMIDSESGALCEGAAAMAGASASIARAVLAGGVILGIVILVHELGHAVAAWACGVTVEAISVGFGPKVAGGRLGRWTRWELRALPVGGFAALKGMEPAKAAPEADSYRAAGLAAKVTILLGGPAANMVLAVAAMTAVEMMGREGPLPVIGWVNQAGPAAAAGLARGDRITRVGGTETPLWADANAAITAAALVGADVDVEWERGATAGQGTLVLPALEGANARERSRRIADGAAGGIVGIELHMPERPVRIEEVSGAAKSAGVEVGDILVAFRAAGHPRAGRGIEGLRGVLRALEPAEGTVAGTVIVERAGTRLERAVEIEPDRDGNLMLGVWTRAEKTAWRESGLWGETRPGAWQALDQALARMISMGASTARALAGLVSGQIAPQVMTGPVGIADIAKSASESGFKSMVFLLAVVSLAIGVTNLLPIPVLDGGRIVMECAQALAGRTMAPKVEMWLFRASAAIVVGVLAFTVVNDLSRIFER